MALGKELSGSHVVFDMGSEIGATKRLPVLFSREASLFRCLGVTGHRVGEPDSAASVVDAIPESAATGHLVLPLLHGTAVDDPSAQIALEAMLTIIVVPGSEVIRCHATRALPGAAAQTFSHPVTASLVA